MDQVVEELRKTEWNALNLAFVDPEGLELRWETISKLAMVKRMDLVINYPEYGLRRVMAKVYKESGENKVDLFFGTNEWRNIYEKYRNRTILRVHRELIDLYKSQLQKLGYLDVKLGDEAGKNEPLITITGRKIPLYRLIFASKHPLGEKFWHEVTRRDVYGQRQLFDSN